MDPVDQHVHSHHSFDCQTEPADNIRQAIAAGLSGISFTEHFDTHPEEWPTCRYDNHSYSATITDLRRRFADTLFIGQGIEVCYQPERMDFILDFLEQHDFDVVLLSVHWAGDKAFHRRHHWAELTVPQVSRLYFQTVLEATRLARDLHRPNGKRVFDILGHLDFIKRYTHRFRETEDVINGQEELIDQILTTCLEADLIPEINTSTRRTGLSESMPGSTIVRRYADLGGRAVSLGSDAHSAADVGADFDCLCAHLPDLGVHSLACFEQRRLRLLPLGDAPR